MFDFEEEFLKKYDSGEKFSEDEICDFIWDTGDDADRQYGDEHRWHKEVKTVKRIGDRFFAVDWMNGLTEGVEPEFPNQPYEVVKHTYKKTVELTDWIPMGQGDKT